MPRSVSPSTSPVVTTSHSTRSTILNHSLAPFYCCYLLRSCHPKRSTTTYIGSTPDPPRRIREHNGQLKGGAFKTRLLRPWEQELIVYNFPSKLQALQFEWAWQNPDKSRLIKVQSQGQEGGGLNAASRTQRKGKGKATTVEEAAPPPKLDGRTKAGRAALAFQRAGLSPPPPAAPITTRTSSSSSTPPQFPRNPLSNRPLSKIQVLQYMLTIPPWSSFPLRVLLFSQEARGWWDQARRGPPRFLTEAGRRKWEKDWEEQGGDDPWGEERGERLDRVVVGERWEGVDGARLVRAQGGGQEGETKERIRVDDDLFFLPHWEKYTALLASNPEPTCGICRGKVDLKDELSFLLCTSGSPLLTYDGPPTPPSPPSPPPAPCHALHHTTCLASHHLPSPPSPSSSAPLLPTLAPCPACDHPAHWQDLVRGAYRRKEEVEGVRKGRRRGRKGTAAAAAGLEEDGKSAGEIKGQGKGKGKVLPSAVAGSGSDDDDEDQERFDLSALSSSASSPSRFDLVAQEEARARAHRSSSRFGAMKEQQRENDGEDALGFYDDVVDEGEVARDKLCHDHDDDDDDEEEEEELTVAASSSLGKMKKEKVQATSLGLGDRGLGFGSTKPSLTAAVASSSSSSVVKRKPTTRARNPTASSSSSARRRSLPREPPSSSSREVRATAGGGGGAAGRAGKGKEYIEISD